MYIILVNGRYQDLLRVLVSVCESNKSKLGGGKQCCMMAMNK